MTKTSPRNLGRNGSIIDSAPNLENLRHEVTKQVEAALRFVEEQATEEVVTFRHVEVGLQEVLFALGRALVVLFLALREQHLMGLKVFTAARAGMC